MALKIFKMFKKIIVIVLLAMVSLGVQARGKQVSDRQYWADLAYRISAPVLENIARDELRKNWPMAYSPTWDGRHEGVAWLEGFGRLMAGISPWLALPDDGTAEGAQRKQLREWALEGYRHAVNPASADYMSWDVANQSLVDASYLALSLMRAPSLWEALDDETQGRYIDEFKRLRKVRPPYNNWVLFRAMIEAFLLSVGEGYDGYAIDMAMRTVEGWYVGDGWYSDGPDFSLDYYNAYVIHPYMVEIADALRAAKIYSPVGFDVALRRMQRYDTQIERLISPEATYPAIGRSMTYRMGAFHTLALSAWKYDLHKKLSNGQVRSALTAVMRRMFAADGIFDDKGFLRLGMVGHQPDLADYYTNSGSLYITALVFLPLGLAPDHDFWTAAPEPWTSQRAWSGEPFNKDYHESIRK